MYYIGVTLQDPLQFKESRDEKGMKGRTAHHDIYFFLDFGQHGFVSDGDSFEDMMCRAVYRGRSSYEIDVCEAA